VITLDQIPERLLRYIQPEPLCGCWLWTGSCDWGGYPKTGNGNLLVHRVLYEMYIGGIERGYDIHHKCGTRWCVNPNHCEALSGVAHRQLRGQRTHCSAGHEYAKTGFWLTKRGHRICKVCCRLAKGQDPRGGNENSRKTHCKRGHKFTKRNTTWLKSGTRVCRKCAVLRTLAWNKRHALTRPPKTHCKRGHEYAVTGFWKNGPNRRICKACSRQYHAAYKANRLVDSLPLELPPSH